MKAAPFICAGFAAALGAAFMIYKADSVRPPHWEDVCTSYTTTLIWMMMDGKNMTLMPTLVCASYGRQCVTGSDYKGPKTGCEK